MRREEDHLVLRGTGFQDRLNLLFSSPGFLAIPPRFRWHETRENPLRNDFGVSLFVFIHNSPGIIPKILNVYMMIE
jgi:hypothetical protein